jgi:CheY-like chemotaxis protein
MHDGTIEARSAGPGQGSEFIVRLPRAATPPHPEPPRPIAPPVSSHAARRILVVDDNVDSANSLAQLLRLDGNEVRTAYDGLRAVDEAAAFRPDVVFLDIGLPRLNGYDTARRIRQQPGGAGVLLIALTGWGQDEDRRRSREAGFDHHLVKPVEPAELKNLLNGTLAECPGS